MHPLLSVWLVAVASVAVVFLILVLAAMLYLEAAFDRRRLVRGKVHLTRLMAWRATKNALKAGSMQ